MSWDGKPNFRWKKTRHGVPYSVTCDDLGCPRTKEDSWQAANEWWRQQLVRLGQAHIDEAIAIELQEISRKIAYAQDHAPELVADLQQVKERIFEGRELDPILEDAAVIERNKAIAEQFGMTFPDDLDPRVAQHFFGNSRLWQDRLKTFTHTAKDKTIGYHLTEFLKYIARNQKPQTYKEIRLFLNRTLDTEVWTSKTSVDTIDETTVNRFLKYLHKHNYAPNGHNKRLGFFRRFIVYLYTSAVIPKMPLNLKLKTDRKKSKPKQIKTYDNVKDYVLALPADKRIWALLNLNCGMTQCDLGELTWDAIDRQNWTLTRVRVKLQDQAKAPMVTYKLWQVTIDALKDLPNQNGLLFTTADGKPMYETRFDENGKDKVKDLFGEYWQDLPKPRIPLAKFRNIGTSVLTQDKLFRQYAVVYLANIPEGITFTHYAKEADNPFFEATEFIRTTLGF